MSVIVTTDENSIVFIPQFTFIDDAVTIPFKNVESSDSATLSESIAPFVFEPRTDSLTFAEAITLSVDLTLFDSATATDKFESITFEQFDAATFADSIGPISILGPHDHVYVGETVSAALNASDSASVEDAVIIGVFIEDSITASEFINDIAFAQTDQAQATDVLTTLSTFVNTFDLDQTYIDFSGFVTANPPGFDHMHWNDEFDYQFIATTLSSSDDPILLEATPNIEILLVESISVSEFASLSLVESDNLTITDALKSLTISVSSQDEFVYQELFELTTDTNVTDSVTVSDAKDLDVNALGTQNITFGENVSITVSVIDSGNLTEIVSNVLTQSDSLDFVENTIISLTQADSIIFSDFAEINASVAKTDSASITERDKSVGLIGKQLGNLIETPFYHADYARLDYLFLISEIGNASVLKTAEETFAVTELTSSIALQGLQLITFKEKIGIRQSAPITLNINDNPTVHGTVTGDIISISIGGTEPVLL